MGCRRWLVGVLFDVVAIALTGVTYFLLERGTVKTIKTGFHLDDITLDAPYTPFEDDSIPSDAVFIVSVLLGLLLFAVEFLRGGCEASWKARQVCARNQWPRVLRIFITYFYGLLLTCVVTSVLKVLVGRLRPHFRDLCRPNYTLPLSAGHSKFITEYECTNPHKVPDKWIQNLYWSFPSGHSSVSAYCCFFFIIYLELRWTHSNGYSVLYKLVPQGVLLAFALIGSYSRVRDHKHHWSDVVTGMALGTVISTWLVLLVVWPIAKNTRGASKRHSLLPPEIGMEAAASRESTPGDVTE